jgi:hypothetical protein
MNTEEPGASNGTHDDSDMFDLSLMTDAGFSEEMEAAEEEAVQVALKLSHRGHRSAVDDAEIYAEANLAKRARRLAQFVIFKHFKKASKVKDEDVGPQPDPSSSLNMYLAFDALFDKGSGRVPFPHVDTFRGRHVDHRGEPIEKLMDTREIEEAMDEIGLVNPRRKIVQECYEQWALTHFHDPIQHYIRTKTPDWDGVSRLDDSLIKLFRPKDTPLTRLVSRYFWLSLYQRIMFPGTLAQLSIALIGAQDAGKSYFSLLLCRTLMGQPDVLPTLLDLGAKDYKEFLRNITGQSIIANVGEMTGMKHGDLNRIKEFVAKPADQFDYKFLSSKTKQRQWITIMDGNGYDGLQRDDTGNRRFYPLFVYQTEDVEGKPAWEKGVRIDYSEFEQDIWQIMAECRDWVAANGFDGWLALTKEVNQGVSAFSESEMNSARGVIRDETVEGAIKQVLVNCDVFDVAPRGTSKGKFFIETMNMLVIFDKLAKIKTFPRALTPHMKAMGFEAAQIGSRGWAMDKAKLMDLYGIAEHDLSVRDMHRHIAAHHIDEELDVADLDMMVTRWKTTESERF